MKKTEIIRDSVFVAGALLLVAGVALIYFPASLIVAGAGLLTVSIRGI